MESLPLEVIIWTIVAVIVAGFSHGVTGFGVGFVAMAIFTSFMPLGQAAALSALVAATTGVTILLRFRRSINIMPVMKLLGGACLGVPIGIFGVSRLPEAWALRLLSAVIIGYCIFSFARPQLSRVKNTNWAYVFGFFSGMLAGGFNAGGPVAIMYGLSQGWSDRAFKSNITGYMLANMAVLIVFHAGHGNLNAALLTQFAWAAPCLVVGVLLGLKMADRINPVHLKNLMLVFLFAMGVKFLI